MLTPTLKVKRRKVVARYGAALEMLYAPGILHTAPSPVSARAYRCTPNMLPVPNISFVWLVR